MSEKEHFVPDDAPAEEPTAERLANIKEKLLNPKYLPSFAEVATVWKYDYNWLEDCRDDKKVSPWEFLTKEFIEAVANYLLGRLEELVKDRHEPMVILEAGAGDGRLAHFLQEKMDELHPGKVKIIPTDTYKWVENGSVQIVFPVERVNNNQEALQNYQPTIVICSWMLADEDWSAGFRAAESVEEYILFGEEDNLVSGKCWDTWGYNPVPFLYNPDEPDKSLKKWEEDIDVDAVELYEKRKNQLSPFKADGFERVNLQQVSEQQVNMYTLPRPKECDYQPWNNRTTAVSFRRIYK